MKFKGAIVLSVILHISLFALAVYMPQGVGSGETVYRVDLMQMPGGGGAGGKKGAQGQMIEEPQRMKDLTTQKEDSQSKLRYADKKSKKKSTRKPKKKQKSLISVVKKKNRTKTNSNVSVTRKKNLGKGVLTGGLTAGKGGGTGGGSGGGSGSGYGTGFGTGNFPYAYYYESLRSKISASWYNALVSPGQRGRHVATVYFKIMRNGSIKDLSIKQKSGIQTLDLSSIRAVENAAPFPPLPNDFGDRYLGVYFEFVWEK